MRHKKIVALCKSNSRIILCGDGRDSVQWLGDNGGFYPMFDLPAYSCDSLCRSYDITEKQAEKITMDNPLCLPPEINFDDMDPDETPVERARISIVSDGIELEPLRTETGIVFIQEKYLQPFGDYKDIEIYHRGVPGAGYFAVKNGMILIGIIMPYSAGPRLSEDIGKVARGIAQTADNK